MPQPDFLTGRASIPMPEFDSSHDVITAEAINPRKSNLPFALGLYAVEDCDIRDRKPLPMFYVSPAVAKDRAVGRHILNGPGVVAGWYVVSRPDTPYEVRFSNANTNTHSGDANCAVLRLFVDGLMIKPDCVVALGTRVGRSANREDFVHLGFREVDEDFGTRIRRFMFGKTTPAKDGGESVASECLSGIVNLKVYARVEMNDNEDSDDEDWSPWHDNTHRSARERAAKRRRRRDSRLNADFDDKDEWYADEDQQKQVINERSIAKKGLSLFTKMGDVVRGQHQTSSRGGGYSLRGVSESDVQQGRTGPAQGNNDLPGYVKSQCRWPEADVKIHVRERFWMRARRLLDDEGKACTHDMFQALLVKDLKKAGSSRRSNAGVGAGSVKGGTWDGTVIDLDAEDEVDLQAGQVGGDVMLDNGAHPQENNHVQHDSESEETAVAAKNAEMDTKVKKEEQEDTKVKKEEQEDTKVKKEEQEDTKVKKEETGFNEVVDTAADCYDREVP